MSRSRSVICLAALLLLPAAALADRNRVTRQFYVRR